MWPGCPTWLQFKLLIDLIFEPVHSEWRQSLPLSLLAKPVDSIIVRTQTVYAISTIWLESGNSAIIFQQSSFFMFPKSLLAVDLQLSEVSWLHAAWRSSQFASKIPVVYQCIFNQLIQILHLLVDSDLFWAFDKNRVILL